MTASPPFVHEAALVETESIGSGTRVWAFAHIMSGAIVGADCNICDHAFIEDGAVVGDRVTVKNNVLIWDGVTIQDDVFVGPNVVFTNDPNPRVRYRKAPSEFVPTAVMEGATLGANATIVCGVTIGEHSMVGAGSVITRDVPSYALVAGNPARQLGWVCECGEKLPADLVCVCNRSYEPTDNGLKQT